MILKCKICGGDMEISADKTFGTCEYCGSTMTLPKIDDEQRAEAFNRGNHFRRIGEYDKALSVYERIVEKSPNDAEAHWCCALCRFGIEWVEDPATTEYLPTCHRASFDIFTNDIDYLAAVELSDGVTQKQYKRDAAKISEVQRGILATSQSEKPYDVFICYKESDDAGNRTVDSTLAQDIYYQLTEQDLRVFFARITLEDKAGSEYEPYIFAALNSAKVMVVVGTKPENFNAVWVKNEWSRFLSIVKHDRSKVLLPCYKDMDPYDLPEQLSVLQSYDMGKIGFIQDLIRGIKKLVKTDEPSVAVKETVVVGSSNANVAPLLERALLFLEDGKWQDANIYCEKVLDIDPKNAEAYVGKLMAELGVNNRKQLADCAEPFDDRDNYAKVLRFGDEKLENEMRGYIAHINERNENARLTGIYNSAVGAMNTANSEFTFKAAADTFKKIPGFKDADELCEQCLDKAEVCRKEEIYAAAVSKMNNATYKSDEALERYTLAIKSFQTISGWKDANEKAAECKKKIEEIKAKEESDRLERERREKEAEKASKKRKKVIVIVTPIVVACIAFVIVLTTVIIPSSKYNKQKAGLTNVSVGSTIKFGFYEQDNNTSNGKEEIEWKVLDVEGNKALVISQYALDCQKYNSTYTDTTWGKCTLRTWLNGTFYDAAFSTDHQKMIVSSTVTADKNPSYNTSPGNNTTDKVFLLSITEVNKHLGSDSARQCQGTAYCYAQGAYTRNGNCWWWLRSPGFYSFYAACVNYDGSVFNYGYDFDRDFYGVRPAMWISLG